MSEEKRKNKPRSRFTAALPKVPKGKTLIAWEQGLASQIKYQKTLRLEAEKVAANSNYKPTKTIGRRYKSFFQEEIALAKQRMKRKNRRRV